MSNRDVTSQSQSKLSPPCTLIKGYLNLKQQNALLKEADSYPLTRPEVMVYGKSHPIPRSQIWFADLGCDYFYSGLFIEAQPWPHYAQKLRHKLEREFGLLSNGVLVNRYANGHESMGWHSDDEKEIAPSSDIASVTVGASRDFFVRHKQTQQKHCFYLESGDLLIMHWPMQKDWEHSLPKRLKVSESRINFTFRQLIVNYHQLK
ncbi:alpha-ketoglutarate-dependent dioxygenase AlkB [Shewanella sp. 10N.261.52.F9]|uniref:alpha-ketoglutarate-dependent dioxygenase AlkB family protein n=1 Tax=Shewanella TaxID=22 RepID=UPI002010B49A|nr:alpha-ketoglutarate-dependent dioxygenase AlkB [Shewanella marinintestina]MCL1146129.1 alpha-ketoglutarate-dependent dioxygenase AlkB [Shewanella marinintestina]